MLTLTVVIIEWAAIAVSIASFIYCRIQVHKLNGIREKMLANLQDVTRTNARLLAENRMLREVLVRAGIGFELSTEETDFGAILAGHATMLSGKLPQH